MTEPLAIITPTLGRIKLLQALSRCLHYQTSSSWLWIVVHDGPMKAQTREALHALSPSAHVIELTRSSKNFGATPRWVGAQHALSLGAKYAVFWDDDNAIFPTAVEDTLKELNRTQFPEALLMRLEFGGRLLPPVGVQPSALRLGQVDTANLVLRAELAAWAYAQVVAQQIRRGTDYFALQEVLRTPNCRVATSHLCIGSYDGLRPTKRILRQLGIHKNLGYWLVPTRVIYTLRYFQQRFLTWVKYPLVLVRRPVE